MPFKLIKKMLAFSKHTPSDQTSIKWSEYSDIYISATSDNGFTVLASKPAATLATELTKNRDTRFSPVN